MWAALRPIREACLPAPIPDRVPTVSWGCTALKAQYIVGGPGDGVQYPRVRQRRSHNLQVTSE